MMGNEGTLTNGASAETFSIKSIIGPMLAIIFGMIMVILDGTVVNVAIPKLVSVFHSDLKTIQWTITGYSLALSAVIPLAGWMTDKFGAKRIFLIVIALFVIGSALCATAQTDTQLIIYRVIQGLGGGMVAPIGMTMVFQLAPAEKRGSIMGMLGVPMLLGPALGPILSGWLVEYKSWHWIFLINVPIGIIAIIVGVLYLPKSHTHIPPRIDIFGMILAPIAFSVLAYGVTQAGTSWTSASTIYSLSGGVVALILLITVELRHKQPLLELRAFGSSDFTRAIILTWIMLVAMYGAMLLMPLYLQQIEHYTPLKTGVILLPQALASAVAMPISGVLYDKVGARPLAMFGMFFVIGALFTLTHITTDTHLWVITVCLGLLGFGMGFTMMPINTHILSAVPKNLVNRVTPLNSAAQQVIVSFAVAGLASYLSSRISTHMSKIVSTGNRSEMMHAALNATVSGFTDTFFLSACLAIVGFLLSLILRKPKPQSGSDSNDDPIPYPVH